MNATPASIADLVDRAAHGERRATGRLLTLVEGGGTAAEEIAERTHDLAAGSHVVGITGAPGAGKSTMVAKLIASFTDADRQPAVLAVDPSSPLTGGAILGDRVRMAEVDTSAFIRSMATRGHAGGLALAVPGAIRVLAAAGYDPVVIETVGVGQVEVDIAAAADTTVVVVTPGMGDAVQANKAGLLEVADIFVVNKADQPGANDARRNLELMLDLSHITGQEDLGHRPPILATNALDGSGIDDLFEAIVDHRDHLSISGTLVVRRRRRARFELAARSGLQFEDALSQALDGSMMRAVIDDMAVGRCSPTAGLAVLTKLLEAPR